MTIIPVVSVRSVPSNPNSWDGQWRDELGEWHTASSQYGAIEYATPEAAVTGAMVAQQEAMKP
jgi:hypothetical protein